MRFRHMMFGLSVGAALGAASCVPIAPGTPCELVAGVDLCGLGLFCMFPDGDCGPEAGTCEPRPTQCTLEFAPVCGCDDRTYGNDCAAFAAGVSIAHQGECDGDCSSNAECRNDEFCEFAEGTCEPDGECAERPEVCPELFAPVCGCDGETYGNACEASAAGVSIDQDGECP